MKIRRTYLVAYQLQFERYSNNMGFGSMVVTTTCHSIREWLRGYGPKEMHRTRKLIADKLRKDLGLGINKRVSIALLNIQKLPI